MTAVMTAMATATVSATTVTVATMTAVRMTATSTVVTVTSTAAKKFTIIYVKAAMEKNGDNGGGRGNSGSSVKYRLVHID